jgi:hypothetical protein
VAAREDAHRDDGEAPPTPFSVPSGWKVVDEKPGNVLPLTLIPDGVGVRVMWNWPASGWSVGQVACRYNGKFKDEANYTVWYSDTQTKGFHMFAVGTHVLAADAPTAPAGAWVIVPVTTRMPTMPRELQNSYSACKPFSVLLAPPSRRAWFS